MSIQLHLRTKTRKCLDNFMVLVELLLALLLLIKNDQFHARKSCFFSPLLKVVFFFLISDYFFPYVFPLV